MTDDLSGVIAQAISKAPEWVKHDLAAKDLALRERAKEALAAMIAAAVLRSQSRPQGKRCSQPTAVQGMSSPTARAG
jgi:hypothetical protein